MLNFAEEQNKFVFFIIIFNVFSFVILYLSIVCVKNILLIFIHKYILEIYIDEIICKGVCFKLL